MAEYIDRERLLRWIDEFGPANKSTIINAPAADVAPVVHGRWIWNGDYCKWVCSVCGGREGECETPTCQWCGAKMDGGKEDG